MHVHEIMTSPVITVAPDTPLKAVAELLVNNRISAVPVVDEAGKVVGMICEGDLMHREETHPEQRHSWWLELFTSEDALAHEYVKSHGRKARDVMSRHVLSVDPSSTLGDVATLLDKGGIKRVPVLDGGKLVGIVSRADLVRALVRMAPADVASEKAVDAEIQMALDAEIKSEPWTSTLTLVTTVHDGVVQLLGFARSDEERRALVVLAQNIPGVSRVEDRLHLRNYADA
jgi:CBS-domain-containing membrane protein